MTGGGYSDVWTRAGAGRLDCDPAEQAHRDSRAQARLDLVKFLSSQPHYRATTADCAAAVGLSPLALALQLHEWSATARRVDVVGTPAESPGSYIQLHPDLWPNRPPPIPRSVTAAAARILKQKYRHQ